MPHYDPQAPSRSDEAVLAMLAEREKEDKWLAEEMEDFTVQMDEDFLPPLKVEEKPVAMTRARTCVAMLSRVEDRIVMLREGGRQAPGCVHLCLSAAWLERVVCKENPDVVDVYMYRGIHMNEHGESFLRTYNPPQKVTYFGNFLTLTVTEGLRDDGTDFDLGRGRWAEDGTAGRVIGCPRTSSHELEKRTNDKLMTRIVLTHARVAVPDTMAFVLKPAYKYLPTEGTRIMMTTWEDRKDAEKEAVEEAVKKFLRHLSRRTEKVVVKPSGPQWMGSRGVSFVKADDQDGVIRAVRELAKVIADGDSVLVDEFCQTLPPQDIFSARELPLRAVLDPSVITETTRVVDAIKILQAEVAIEAEPESAMGSGKHSRAVGMVQRAHMQVLQAFRMRVLVQRTDSGRPVVSKIVCAVGPADEPLHGANTVPQTLEATLQQWGIEGEKYKDVKTLIETEARVAFDALAQMEARLKPSERGGPLAQTDAVGLDIILADRNGAIEPVVIEVNDHDSVYHSIMVEHIFRETEGECVVPWVANMIQRSHQYLRKNMTLVVVGAGGSSKLFLWPLFREKGFKVVLLEHDAKHPARELVDHFVHVPEMEDHSKDATTVDVILKRLEERGFTRDTITGCVTYWEDCSPLNAALCERLGKIGNGYDAHTRAKSKFRTHKHLSELTHRLQHTTRMSSVPSRKVNSEEELEEALKKTRLPALLKGEHGSSAVGVVMVETADAARQAYKRLVKELSNEQQHPGAGISFAGGSGGMVLMDYIDGSEHDVDVLMYDGKALFAAISDNAPTKLPYFSETAACMPSRLHQHRQRALIDSAVYCLRGLGLRYGAFNVELKYTTIGPRLIEVNARMGGFYLRDWILRVYGVDMALSAAMIACGVPPAVPPRVVQPTAQLVGAMLYASDHGDQLRKGKMELLKELHEEGEIVLNIFESEIPEVAEFEEPICNVAVQASSFHTARSSLSSALTMLRLNKAGKIPLDWFLENI